MELLTVSIDSLMAAHWNPNRVSPENERKIERSLTELGTVKPLIVRVATAAVKAEHVAVTGETVGTYVTHQILGGHHRFEVMKRLGYESVEALNLGEMDDERAKKIALIDNARYGDDDAVDLAEVLESIGTPAEVEQILPYTDSQLEALFASTEIDLDGLDLDDDDEDAPDTEEPQSQVTEPPTHMLFQLRVPIEEAGDVSRVLSAIAKTQGFVGGTDKENAGEALAWLARQKDRT